MLLEEVDLLIDAAAEGDHVRVQLSGDLDTATAGSLTTITEKWRRSGHRHFVLDCAEVTFCNSWGLRAMTALLAAVEPDGSVTIRRPSGTLSRLLGVTGLAAQFGVTAENDEISERGAASAR